MLTFLPTYMQFEEQSQYQVQAIVRIRCILKGLDAIAIGNILPIMRSFFSLYFICMEFVVVLGLIGTHRQCVMISVICTDCTFLTFSSFLTWFLWSIYWSKCDGPRTNWNRFRYRENPSRRSIGLINSQWLLVAWLTQIQNRAVPNP